MWPSISLTCRWTMWRIKSSALASWKGPIRVKKSRFARRERSSAKGGNECGVQVVSTERCRRNSNRCFGRSIACRKDVLHGWGEIRGNYQRKNRLPLVSRGIADESEGDEGERRGGGADTLTILTPNSSDGYASIESAGKWWNNTHRHSLITNRSQFCSTIRVDSFPIHV